ncbi:MAG: DUF6607 family protein [Planctomycetota bacterium]
MNKLNGVFGRARQRGVSAAGRVALMGLLLLPLLGGCVGSPTGLALISPTSPEANPSSFEADREAILAMVGEFKVTFQFEETVAVESGYELKEPYLSGATEFVEVLEDRGDFISLQHVLVMHPQKEDGSLDQAADPVVVKHWRQDWTYEDTQVMAFRGNRTWEKIELSPEEVGGTWSQAVFQVDDSPRYESFGPWTHVAGHSVWESGEVWRPLPRREFSKRSDYNVLVARNRHTLTPAGWVHEQDNYKLVLDDAGRPERVIAHETGLNEYFHTDDVDFAAGRTYMEETGEFWSDVRSIWGQTFAQRDRVELRGKVDGEKMFAKMFALANEVRESGYTPEHRQRAGEVVSAFLVSE